MFLSKKTRKEWYTLWWCGIQGVWVHPHDSKTIRNVREEIRYKKWCLYKLRELSTRYKHEVHTISEYKTCTSTKNIYKMEIEISNHGCGSWGGGGDMPRWWWIWDSMAECWSRIAVKMNLKRIKSLVSMKKKFRKVKIHIAKFSHWLLPLKTNPERLHFDICFENNFARWKMTCENFRTGYSLRKCNPERLHFASCQNVHFATHFLSCEMGF